MECAEGSPDGCLRCRPSHYLRPASALAIVGSCEQSCLPGFFVQPSSQRCQTAPADVHVERFYLRLTLRVSVEDFLADANTLTDILQKSAETLAVSSQELAIGFGVENVRCPCTSLIFSHSPLVVYCRT
eukprot:symbB.v1.2.022020.t1/scaffold1885.1/size149428/1